jgi:sugar-specific transcriptional regulator TrmB
VTTLKHHYQWGGAGGVGEKPIKQLLKELGLTETEAEVYLFLSKQSALKGTEIAKRIQKDKAQVYHILRSLQVKGLVETTLEAPVRFAPVPFESVVESAIKAKRKEAQRIETTKNELLTYWKNLNKQKADLQLEKFVVIEGQNKVYDKISQMIAKTDNQLSMISNKNNLLKGYQLGIYASISKRKGTGHIQYRLLIELSGQNNQRVNSIIDLICREGFTIRRRPDTLGLELSTQIVLRDREELLIFINPNIDVQTIDQDDICFWTNCKTIVQSFAEIFENQWQASQKLQTPMQRSKNSGQSRKDHENKLEDEKTLTREYLSRLKSAEKKIEIITTTSGLIDLNKDFESLLRERTKMGVSVKIVAPIVKDNFKAAEQLSGIFAVRHMPVNYCKTIVIDEKHLFQWRSATKSGVNANPTSNSEGIFYTKDPEYLRNVKSAFAEIWENGQIPSAITLDSIKGDLALAIFPIPTSDVRFGSKIIDFEPPGSITEKDILEKIMNPERIVCTNPGKDVSRMYASMATVLIHPPKSFNLPSLVIQPAHVDKNSSFGAEDYIVILLQLEKSPAYIPVAFIGENPNAQEVIKQVYAGCPAGKNVRLVNKDEIQIRLHGNTMFAGWTVPIPLYPTSYVLPPACLLIEGYGNVKTSSWTVLMGSGFKVKIEANYLNSYVEFIHPSSKYSGPGTNAILMREYISTNFPPQNDLQ